ncbi:TIGR03364 family FAD-dependent oxidoreductase [Sinomonas sp. ASV322]|uniref:TIGR03364 family FAD-dependent oxidoreductase n=1 Tax=Sinomonas sp. ASV322 TaxID=3041920 RepID=UPI0027DBC39A|nr:TIGR03364 family FAD-dependent oxidoreductase [Sinomonas sp. ASV322]MDQ4502605.1 TIGR03364 family FAD-dependent oxidoreductase [Sinomonas sp. ASV322]
MSTTTATPGYDLLVVGAGVVGLAHAAAAAERGLRVLVIERDGHAVSASVRNFGHCCVTAQAGELLDLARVARERWLSLSSAAGFWSTAAGGLAIARSAAELAVLEELAAARADGGVRLVSASEAREQMGGGLDAAAVGAAVLEEDVRVDPRSAVVGLAAWLERQPLVDIRWRTAYLGPADDGGARTSRGTVAAAQTIVCAGHDLDYLFPDAADAADVKRCGLQMALVDAPSAGGTAAQIAPAVLTGTSMLRYPAFSTTTAAVELRAELERTRPELIGIDANVMLTQRPDGSLLIGDSHVTLGTMPPFLDEATSATLLANAAELLGVERLSVRQRWQGIYASSAQSPYLIAEVAPRVTAVSVTSGVGMTISHGLAQKVLDQLMASA